MKSRFGEANKNYRHGGNTVNRPEYNSWRAMIARCYNPKYRRYDRYGGRGITVCDRWREKPKGFINFLEDMGKKPNRKFTLDRIDNNGNYEPGNCRWATQKLQIRNSSIRKTYKAFGIEASIAEFAKLYNVSFTYIYLHLNKGEDLESILVYPHIRTEAGKAMARQRHIASIPDCPECGTKCKSKQTKFCSSHCYMVDRGRREKLTRLQSVA